MRVAPPAGTLAVPDTCRAPDVNTLPVVAR